MDQMYSNQEGGKKSKTLFYIIIAIVVLLVIYWLFTMDFGQTPGEEVSEINPGETVRTAQEGEIVSGFPTNLILEEGIVSNDSYSINYSEAGVDQPVVTYTSALSLEENIDLYGSYLRANNWNLTHEATVDEAPITYFYAKKENRDMNLTFDAQGDSVQVTMAVAIKEAPSENAVEENTEEGS